MRVVVPTSDTTELRVIGVQMRQLGDERWTRAFWPDSESFPNVDLPTAESAEIIFLLALEIDERRDWAAHDWESAWSTEEVR